MTDSTTGLSNEELTALMLTGELTNMMFNIVGNGPTRDADLREYIAHIHAIQNMLMSQAGARQYNGIFRILGEE